MFLFHDTNILAPLNGKCIPLSEVNDEVFAKNMMGPGCAIIPIDGEVVSPVKGEVSVIAPTKHCIIITNSDGLQILIHFGIDSFIKEGDGFIYKVNVGDKVKKGQSICKIDLDSFKEKNIDITTPVVVVNHENFIVEDSEHLNSNVTNKDILFKYKIK